MKSQGTELGCPITRLPQGDLRIDQMIIRHSRGEDPSAALLVRVGDQFQPAAGTGERGRLRLADGRVVKFDSARHEWVEAK